MNGKRIITVLTIVPVLLVSLSGAVSAQQKKQPVTSVIVNTGPVKTLNSLIFLSPGELMNGWNNSDKTVTNKVSYAVEDGEVRGYLAISGTSGIGTWNYAGSQRFPLIAGRTYRLSGWMLVSSINDPAWPPYLKCTLFQNDKWLNNFNTIKYDLARQGEWQLLSVEFSVPVVGGYKGNLALEKGTKDTSLEIKVVLRDLQIDLIE
ncbi:MAG: hypothetical protein JJE30_03640 [Desulfuromonadales bacterium]|nr:hypothetical protein [Desulfuromonadales bacterium]